jgi:hypothetical protein
MNRDDLLPQNSDPVFRITGARKNDSGINPTDDYNIIKKNTAQEEKLFLRKFFCNVFCDVFCDVRLRSSKFLLEIRGTDVGCPLEAHDGFAVFLTPLHALVEAAAPVVLPEGQNIKIDLFKGFHTDRLINNDFVDGTKGSEDLHTLFCGIEDMGIRLEFQDIIAVLYRNDQIIRILSALHEQAEMADMEIIVNAEGKYLFHMNIHSL